MKVGSLQEQIGQLTARLEQSEDKFTSSDSSKEKLRQEYAKKIQEAQDRNQDLEVSLKVLSTALLHSSIMSGQPYVCKEFRQSSHQHINRSHDLIVSNSDCLRKSQQ